MSSYELFLKEISLFETDKKESLITEYNEVLENLEKRIPVLMESLKPGPELRRSYGNVYSDGNFSVYWAEKKIVYDP
jgi:hypothetical protein